MEKVISWLPSVRFRDIQGKLVKILGSFHSEQVIDPLINVVLIQNHNAMEALNLLSKYHQERIYTVACDAMFAESGWIVGAAARVLAGYPEFAEQSMDLLKNAGYSAMNNYGPGEAIEQVLKTMWSLDPEKTLDYCSGQVQTFISNDSVKIKFLNFFWMLKTDFLSQRSKLKTLEIIREILSAARISNLDEKRFQEKATILEKQI
jgi:hypothetical protein